MRNFPKRGEIYLVNFDRTVGSEIKKTRPAVIIQNDIANRYSPVTIVAALTSAKESSEALYPTEVALAASGSGLPKNSIILLNQLRTVDRARLAEKIGTVPRETLRAINRALALSIGLLDV